MMPMPMNMLVRISPLQLGLAGDALERAADHDAEADAGADDAEADGEPGAEQSGRWAWWIHATMILA